MNDHPNDEFDELMRRALSEEADRIDPADGLHEIQARVRIQRKPVNRRPWVLTAGAAVLGTAAAIGAFAVLDDDARKAGETEVAGPSDATTTATSRVPASKTPATAPPTLPTAEPSTYPKAGVTERGTPEVATKLKAVPVYWLGKTAGNQVGPGVRLYRTFEDVRGRPALEAVRLLTAAKPSDPDYYSPWTGAAVSSLTQSRSGVVTVDFKMLPRERLDPEVAHLAVQQLVYTVQGALGDQSQQVQVTERGQTDATLFGQIKTNQVISRAQAADVQALVWILTPTEGAATRDPLTVTGVAAAFEAHVNWQATNLKTKTVHQGFTTAKEGQKFSPFSFTTNLGPGEWRVEVFLISPADGRITDTDSKVVTVK